MPWSTPSFHPALSWDKVCTAPPAPTAATPSPALLGDARPHGGTFGEGRPLGLQSDLHHIQGCHCNSITLLAATPPPSAISQTTALSSPPPPHPPPSQSLTKEGGEDGTRPGGQHLLQGRDGHTGPRRCLLSHGTALLQHTACSGGFARTPSPTRAHLGAGGPERPRAAPQPCYRHCTGRAAPSLLPAPVIRGDLPGSPGPDNSR